MMSPVKYPKTVVAFGPPAYLMWRFCYHNCESHDSKGSKKYQHQICTNLILADKVTSVKLHPQSSSNLLFCSYE